MEHVAGSLAEHHLAAAGPGAYGGSQTHTAANAQQQCCEQAESSASTRTGMHAHERQTPDQRAAAVACEPQSRAAAHSIHPQTACSTSATSTLHSRDMKAWLSNCQHVWSNLRGLRQSNNIAGTSSTYGRLLPCVCNGRHQPSCVACHTLGVTGPHAGMRDKLKKTASCTTHAVQQHCAALSAETEAPGRTAWDSTTGQAAAACHPPP